MPLPHSLCAVRTAVRVVLLACAACTLLLCRACACAQCAGYWLREFVCTSGVRPCACCVAGVRAPWCTCCGCGLGGGCDPPGPFCLFLRRRCRPSRCQGRTVEASFAESSTGRLHIFVFIYLYELKGSYINDKYMCLYFVLSMPWHTNMEKLRKSSLELSVMALGKQRIGSGYSIRQQNKLLNLN